MAKHKETKFLEALSALFVGARVDGDSGFINLMRIKRAHFESIRGALMEEIDRRVAPDDDFREDLFGKLHNFFRRYFCESGSIYFRHLPAFARVYERAYRDGADVALMWKTRYLYYVKSDILARSMAVDLDGGARFYFDASKIQNKRANERRDFVFAFERAQTDERGRTAVMTVSYSEKGRKTKSGDIVKAARAAGVKITEDDLQAACRKFCRQTEADFFIHKNAGDFLREQFDLWLFCYAFSKDGGRYTAKRVEQFRHLQEIAYCIIGFIAQFEDELRRVWEKPKFARDVNFVITLSKLPTGCETRKKIAAHKGANAQIAEWRRLGIVDENFAASQIAAAESHLPLDTRHFKDLECEMLSHLGDLDAALDGELIHSENWQALNTLRHKYAGRVKCIYIDPPFNTGKDFYYKDQIRTSTWLSLMNDRLPLVKKFLHKEGGFYLHLDENANFLGKLLLNEIGFDEIQEIIFDTNATKDPEADLFAYKSFGQRFVLKHNVIFYCFNQGVKFVKLWKPNRVESKLGIGWLDLISVPQKPKPEKISDYRFFIERYSPTGDLERDFIDVKDEKIYPLGDLWSDIYSFTQSEMRTSENCGFPTQKPENLLRRIIQSSTVPGNLVMDCFLGSGTSIAVAHKLGRKWVGVEMGGSFHDFYYGQDEQGEKIGILGRMKIVLFGDQRFNLLGHPRRSHLSKQINWTGGGAFKYYTLEQYEETLKNARYKTDTSAVLIDAEKTPFEQYVFFADDKLAHLITPPPDQAPAIAVGDDAADGNDSARPETNAAAKTDDANPKIGDNAAKPENDDDGAKTDGGGIAINLQDLYADISIAESIANIRGAQIRRQTPTEITLTNGETHKTAPAQMTEPEKHALITALKPYLWWGE